MAAPARPLTSTAELDDAIELRCPGTSPRGDGSACNRLLSKVAAVGCYQVSLVCPRCHQRTTFEVPADG